MPNEKVPLDKGKNRIISPKRKKLLMKKLAKIKCRSRGNNSFVDISTHYETKFRKLKTNNNALAKALADQRQISKTWYEEVVTVKEELHHSQESLLRCRVRENDEYDHIIQAAVERRIRTIADPLDSFVKGALHNVSSLVNNLTKIQELLLSLNVNREKLNCRRSSGNSRPPLSRTPKSPRKNVVHPMVDGHVLQPASIHIPRMNLEDRRRYRLEERAETREDPEMSAINEQSSVVEDEPAESESNSDAAETEEAETPPVPSEDIPMEEDNSTEVGLSILNDSISNIEESQLISEVNDSMIIRNENTLPIVEPLLEICSPVVESAHEISSPITSPNVEELKECSVNLSETPEEVSEMEVARISPLKKENHFCRSSPSSKEKATEKEAKFVPKEMKLVPISTATSPERNPKTESTETQSPKIATKNGPKGKSKIDRTEDPLEGSSWMHTKKKRNSKRKKSSKESNIRTSGMHFLLTSSDSEDEEIEKSKPIPLRVKLVKVKGKKKISSDSISPKKDISTPPHLELLSNVGRRSKKQVRGSSVSSIGGKESQPEPQRVPLESFIIRDESSDEQLAKENSKTFTDDNCESETVHSKSVESIASPPKSPEVADNEGLNATCLLNTPMEMTECLPKGMLREVRVFKSPMVPVVSDGDKAKSRISNGSKSKSPASSKEDGFKSPATPNISKFLCPNSLIIKLKQVSPKENRETNTKSNINSNLLDGNNQVKEAKIKTTSKIFFKRTEDEDTTKIVKPVEKTPFDLSAIDASTVEDCYLKLGKENVPPNVNSNVDLNFSDPNMKLKNISIIVEDIMKTPASATASPEAKSSSQSVKVSSSLFSSKSTKSATNDKDKDKNKRKRKPAQKESPSKKTAKKPKKIKVSEVKESPAPLPTSDDDDDAWSPPKKKITKRKTKVIKKNTKVPPIEVQAESVSDPPSNTGKQITKSNDEMKKNNKVSPIEVKADLPPSNTRKESVSKNNDETHAEKPRGIKVNSDSKTSSCHRTSNTVTNGEPNIEYLSLDEMLSSPELTNIYKNVNNLIRNSIDKPKPIECDPLQISIDVDDDEDDDDIQIIEPNSVADPLGACTRPRRAASKISSFKEPSLGSKLRREDSCGKKTRKKIVKKLQQIPVT